MVVPIASPSRPSVRLTAFAAPTITSIVQGRNIGPRSGVHFLKNGTLIVVG